MRPLPRFLPVFEAKVQHLADGEGKRQRSVKCYRLKSESLTVEFKSDVGFLADSDLIAAVVCLANTEGGALYVGVEDDGAVTGLHERHRNVTGVVALIANRTSPSLSVRAELLEVNGPLRTSRCQSRR